jgi:hypothetical protein
MDLMTIMVPQKTTLTKPLKGLCNQVHSSPYTWRSVIKGHVPQSHSRDASNK